MTIVIDMTLDALLIETRVRAALPGAEIVIDDPRADGMYLVVHVSDPAFAGLTRVQQHRLVYKALGEAVIDPPPTLSLRTYVPAAKP